MRRQLFLLGITCALLLNGWSVALAAALCPHASVGRASMQRAVSPSAVGEEGAEVMSNASGETLPACCRREGTEEKHCPMQRQKAVGHKAVGHAEQPTRPAATEEGSHVEAADAAVAHASVAGASGHTAMAASKQDEAASHSVHNGVTDNGGSHAAGSSPPIAFTHRSCAHCAGRPEQQPTGISVREQPGAKRVSVETQSAAAQLFAPPCATFIKAVLHSDGAPPGAHLRRHVLIGIFLI